MSFNPHKNPVFSVNCVQKWRAERISDLLKLTQKVCGQDKVGVVISSDTTLVPSNFWSLGTSGKVNTLVNYQNCSKITVAWSHMDTV